MNSVSLHVNHKYDHKSPLSSQINQGVTKSHQEKRHKITQQVLELLDEFHGVLLVDVVKVGGPLGLLLGGLLPAEHLRRQ